MNIDGIRVEVAVGVSVKARVGVGVVDVVAVTEGVSVISKSVFSGGKSVSVPVGDGVTSIFIVSEGVGVRSSKYPGESGEKAPFAFIKPRKIKTGNMNNLVVLRSRRRDILIGANYKCILMTFLILGLPKGSDLKGVSKSIRK
jgi:hypothetical protein